MVLLLLHTFVYRMLFQKQWVVCSKLDIYMYVNVYITINSRNESRVLHQIYTSTCLITITVSIPLLMESPRVSSAQQSMFLSLCRYLCWWSIIPRGYPQLSSQCFYHCVETSAGGVPACILSSVVNVSITVSIPLLVEYYSPRVSSAQQSMFLSLCRYLCWWSPRGYPQLGSQCFYHCRYLCWWSIIPRGYPQLSSQCFGTAMVYYILVM